jgi:hypothetical protein
MHIYIKYPICFFHIIFAILVKQLSFALVLSMGDNEVEGFWDEFKLNFMLTTHRVPHNLLYLARVYYS